MLNAAHVLETALLILAAFLIGATVGTLARLAFRRPQRAAVAIATPQPVATPEPPVAEAPALVTAPTIDPLPKPAAPVVPADIPAPDFAAAIQPEATTAAQPLATTENSKPRPKPVAPAATGAAMAPARAAGQTTSGRLVPAPMHDEPKRAAASLGAPTAEVIPFPARSAGGAAEKNEAAATAELSAAAAVVVQQADPAPTELPAAPAPTATETAPAVEAPAEPEVAVAEPPVLEKAEVAASSPQAENDEAAAMRAIEGNWSPRRRPPVRRAADPEPAPAAPPVEQPGRPVGLEAPRAGGKDDLTHVIGVLPIIETALNSIGVYHFDQLAAFSDENVAWLENHLGIEGRIGREHWREQARELAVASSTAAKAAGQQ